MPNAKCWGCNRFVSSYKTLHNKLRRCDQCLEKKPWLKELTADAVVEEVTKQAELMERHRAEA